jgi:hypothetical protein
MSISALKALEAFSSSAASLSAKLATMLPISDKPSHLPADRKRARGRGNCRVSVAVQLFGDECARLFA